MKVVPSVKHWGGAGLVLLGWAVVMSACGGTDQAPTTPASECSGLSEGECTNAGCLATFGDTRVDGEVARVYAGCAPGGMSCSDYEPCAVDATDDTGACVAFPNGCLPDRYEEVPCSIAACLPVVANPSRCSGLPEGDCADVGCHPTFGTRLVDGEAREVYTGCMGGGLTCTANRPCTVDTNDDTGACVVFSDGCFPGNFEEISCSLEACAEVL